MSEFTLLVLGVIGVISAGVAGVVSIKRSAAKAEQTQSAYDVWLGTFGWHAYLQAERTVNKSVQTKSKPIKP